MSKHIKSPSEDWIPGVLHKSQIQELYGGGLISTVSKKGLDIKICSVDLSLSSQVFKMKRGSIKPSEGYQYDEILKDKDFAEIQPLDSRDGSYLLGRHTTYVIKLQERLHKEIGSMGIHGQATAKSSVGRIDVLARLIVDGMDKYESFDPKLLEKATGEMYVEITPITFNVRVRPETSINQLRLFYGSPADAEIAGVELFRTILGPDAKDNSLSVDLDGEKIDGGLTVAYRTRRPVPEEAVPLWKTNPAPDPRMYWETVRASADKRMQIEESKFYILKSKERLRVPGGVAIYCKAIDETIGEMRIHYAGFVHPFFGVDRKDGRRGTSLIFEVRGHQVNANIIHAEKLAILTFYRTSKDCTDEDKPKEDDDYNNQTLKLSGFFENAKAKRG